MRTSLYHITCLIVYLGLGQSIYILIRANHLDIPYSLLKSNNPDIVL